MAISTPESSALPKAQCFLRRGSIHSGMRLQSADPWHAKPVLTQLPRLASREMRGVACRIHSRQHSQNLNVSSGMAAFSQTYALLSTALPQPPIRRPNPISSSSQANVAAVSFCCCCHHWIIWYVQILVILIHPRFLAIYLACRLPQTGLD